MGKLSFLKQKKFYINLLMIILLSFIILWLTLKLLNIYTRHDKVYELPDFTGMTTEEVEKTYGKEYNFILIDSVYSKTEAPGTIVQQDPLAKSKVKQGRNIYYIIVAKTPEKTSMPNLKNLSLRQALVLLESNGLQVESLKYVDHFARNAICEQRYENSIIKPGTEIVKGSKIMLYVGLGPDQQKTQLPSLYGVSAEEVQHILNMAGLNLGNEVFTDSDSIQYMKVYKMDPPFSKGAVNPGTYVNVWYHSNKQFDFDKERNNLLHEDSLKYAEEHITLIDSASTVNDTIASDIEENYEDDF